jgi:phage tail-like protein
MAREVPYGVFNFLVSFDGDDRAFGGFSDASGLGTELTVAQYRNGGDPENHVRKVPGMHKVNDVTLKRGIINSATLWEWFKQAHTTGVAARKNVTVTLLDEAREAVQRWELLGCYPMKYTGPTLAAKGGEDVAMEELVLAVEAFDVKV